MMADSQRAVWVGPERGAVAYKELNMSIGKSALVVGSTGKLSEVD